ncbi:MAG: hypothetical protein HDR92_02995 [Bacteroides sp.]|nr:hypothetical protein [Bacteroides sp.]
MDQTLTGRDDILQSRRKDHGQKAAERARVVECARSGIERMAAMGYAKELSPPEATLPHSHHEQNKSDRLPYF